MKFPQKNILIEVAVSIIICVNCSTAAFPSDIRRCFADDTECLQERIKQVVLKYRNGYEGIHLIPLDPLLLKNIDVNQTNAGLLDVNISTKSVKAFGIPGAKILKVVGFGSNPETSSFEIHSKIPSLSLIGNYKAVGRLFFMPVDGEGTFNTTLENVSIGMRLIPTVLNKNEENFLYIRDIDLNINPERVKLNISNLLVGRNAFAVEVMHEFLNQNSMELWKEAFPVFKPHIVEMLKDLMNRVFLNFPYNQLILIKSKF